MVKKGAGKVKDKWKAKQWVTVLASPSFGNAPIGRVPLTDIEKPGGRVVETTLYDILKQDPQHYSFKLYFQIDQVEGDTAYTVLKGHEYSREYLSSLIRRGSSMSDFIKDYTTKDGYIVRVYCIALSQGRMNSSKKHEIRNRDGPDHRGKGGVAHLRPVRPGDRPPEGRLGRLQRGEERHQAATRRSQEDQAHHEARGRAGTSDGPSRS